MNLIALRAVFSSLAYMVALATVLVVGLGIWTEFHISLRSWAQVALAEIARELFSASAGCLKRCR